MSDFLAWLTPERINAIALLIGALSALYHVVVNVKAGWGSTTPGEKWDRVMSVLKAAHDAVEKLKPVIPEGTAPAKFVEIAHKLLDLAGLDKPDADTTKALGTAIHEAYKADKVAAAMAADPTKPGAAA